jgi:Skp family chaperone for outer membrane proteins
MKNLLTKSFCALFMLSLIAGPVLAQERLATVDLRKIFENYWKRKEGDAAIKDRVAVMEKENAEMLETFKKGREEYNALLTSANDQAVSAEEKDKRKKAAEDKLKQLKVNEESISQYQKQARETVEQQMRRMRENILSEIRTVVNAKAQAAGYAVVIDTAAETVNGTPVVLYSSGKDHDLTETVLAQLNAAAPAGTRTEENKTSTEKK